MTAGTEFDGLIAPPPTAMTAEGELRLDAVEAQAAALAANGVVGAFVCGTTGEGVSLTVRERMALARRWRDVAPPGFRVIVHVGCLAVADARALAAHAAEIGADGVAALPPLYFKPRNVEDLLASCAAVADAAPDLPFYYYHIPALTGVALPVHELLAAAEGRVDNLAGAKFTSEDLMDFRQCLDLSGGRFEMFFGRDEILLSALALGARAAVGTTYNFAAPLCLRIVEAHRAGRAADAAADQARAMRWVAIFRRHGGGPAAAKAVMALIGPDPGPVRPPLRDLSADRRRALADELADAGFFDLCSRGP